MSAATKAEDGLIREKAASMTLLELQAEIARCRYGISVAANLTARARFLRRLGIMEEAISNLGTKPGGTQ